MDLDHERLDVYHLALDFLVLASEVIEGLPRRGSGQALEARQATVLSDGARLGDGVSGSAGRLLSAPWNACPPPPQDGFHEHPIVVSSATWAPSFCQDRSDLRPLPIV